MKLNPVLTIVSLLIGALVFYGYYAFGAGMEISIIASVIMTLWLVSIMALHITIDPRRTILLNTVTGVLLTVTFPLNIVFAWLNVQLPIVVIANAVTVIVWFVALYAALSKTK